MQDRRIAGVEIMHSPCSLQCHSFSLLPTERQLKVLNIGPKWPPRAILKYNCEIGWFGTCSQKHHHVWVSQCFHGRTFAKEVPNCTFWLNFEHFDSNCCFSPQSFVDDSVASFRNLALKY
jgi:hypothetical protein